MKLGYISEAILESKFPIWDFIYPDYETDPTPKALVLGFYEHPRTGNQLMAGVNVRLINARNAQKLLEILDNIGSGTNTKERVRLLERLAKPIFDKAYRTYDVGKMKQVRKGTVQGSEVNNIPVVKKPQDAEQEKQEVRRDVDRPEPEPQELSKTPERGERGLDQGTDRPEDEVRQRPDRTVPSVADEEY